ncbi:MAG: YodC family protein [Chitinivibrionales bacterium]
MSEQFEVGQVVQLKSGGQKMTIEEIEDGGYVSCVWFEGSIVQRGTFAAATLQKYKPAVGSIGISRA